jgi:hypothetical protein
MFEQPHTVLERYREIERMRALELAVGHADANRMFLPVGAADVESPHRLFVSVKQLQALLPSGWELGITISLPADIDILKVTEIYREAQELELLVAFDEFQGNGGQLMHVKPLLPDYLVLSANMTKDLAVTRQPLRRLESLLQACEELAIKPVLPRGCSDETVAFCQEIGLDLVLKSATRTATSPRAELSVTV